MTPTLTPPDLGSQPLLAAGDVDGHGINFALIVRALSANSDVNLLSTPSIMTMDNQEAKIVVGKNVPFRTGSTTGNQGNNINNPFTTISREDVGLTLQVTPHIHDGNLIRLEISQEVSEVDDLQNIGTEGAADIITNQRTIETTILAENGEVIVLGGLMRDKVTNSSTGVPLLMNIPWLGRLFKSTSEIREKQNLLIFLRPTVITSREDSMAINDRKFTGVWEFEIEGVDSREVIGNLFDGKRP
jgi:general secretion pathway protein D